MFKNHLHYSVISKIAVALALIVLTTAYSEAKTFTTKPGVAVVLTSISLYDEESCGAMPPPKYRINQTSHGKLKVIPHKVKLDKGSCAGRTIKFFFVVYFPDRGFKGTDRGSVVYDNPQFTDSIIRSSRKFDAIIKVK